MSKRIRKIIDGDEYVAISAAMEILGMSHKKTHELLKALVDGTAGLPFVVRIAVDPDSRTRWVRKPDLPQIREHHRLRPVDVPAETEA